MRRIVQIRNYAGFSEFTGRIIAATEINGNNFGQVECVSGINNNYINQVGAGNFCFQLLLENWLYRDGLY